MVEVIPALARAYLPLLLAALASYWPDAPEPHFVAGQIEQETCTSLTSPRCWSPRAELRTSRENGIGLGQLTIAYRADGSVRFDAFADARQLDASLRDWEWANRYDPKPQVTAIVLMDRNLFVALRPLAIDDDAGIRFALSSYNGGKTALLEDRTRCNVTPACDPRRWAGNVERTSYKSNAPLGPGYGGQTPFGINRGYVRQVMDERRAKYLSFFKG